MEQRIIVAAKIVLKIKSCVLTKVILRRGSFIIPDFPGWQAHQIFLKLKIKNTEIEVFALQYARYPSGLNVYQKSIEEGMVVLRIVLQFPKKYVSKIF